MSIFAVMKIVFAFLFVMLGHWFVGFDIVEFALGIDSAWIRWDLEVGQEIWSKEMIDD